MIDEQGNLKNGGIRGIYGKTGLESISMLEDMISRITEKYYKDGDWITTSRKMVRHRGQDGRIISYPEYIRQRCPLLCHDNSNSGSIIAILLSAIRFFWSLLSNENISTLPSVNVT